MNKYIFIAALLMLLGIAVAHAADDTVFERVQSGRYAGMLRDGSFAYDRKEYDQAFELTRRTACAGDKISQAMLGRMYLLGQGVTRDDLTGYGWIKAAAEFNFAGFTSLARKLENAIEPDLREQASARAAEFRKSYGLVATGMSCRGESGHGVYLIDSVVCTPQSDGGGMVLLRRCLDDGK